MEEEKKVPVVQVASLLTAKDHILRLHAYTELLMDLAKKGEKTALILGLRGIRADTSWLLNKLSKGTIEVK
jgi:phosphopantetheine adenylyltransferase